LGTEEETEYDAQQSPLSCLWRHNRGSLKMEYSVRKYWT